MTRVVYVGGFANGRSLAEGVGYALERDYEEVDTFTFSDAMKRPDDIRRAVAEVDVFTHSAGMMALLGTKPEYIHAFNVPVPTSRSRLFGRTLIKTAHMHMPGRGVHEVSDVARVAKFDTSAIGELAVHPIANLRPFIKKQISEFNGIQSGLAARNQGIGVNFITTSHDDYFPDTASSMREVGLANLFIALPGEHDELPLRPEATLDNYRSATDVNFW